MSFTNGQYGDDSYLVYQMEADDVVETMSFGQITNNLIEGLAPATFTQMDTTRSVMYKITSHMSLEDFLQRTIKKKHLLKLLSGIVGAIRAAQEYMIDPAMFLLDRKFVFVKTSPFSVSLICLPVQQSPYRRMGLQEFLWNLVVKARTDSSESREYVSVLMEQLDPENLRTMEELEKLLESVSQGATAPAEPANPTYNPPAPAYNPPAPAYNPPAPAYNPPAPAYNPPAPAYNPPAPAYNPPAPAYNPPAPAYNPPQDPVRKTHDPIPEAPKSYDWESGLKDNFGAEAREQEKKGGLFGKRAPKEKPVKEEKPKKEPKKEPEKKVNRKEPHHFDLVSSDRPVAIFDEPEEPVQKPYEAPASIPGVPFEMPSSQKKPAYDIPAAPKKPAYETPASQNRMPFEVPGVQSSAPFEVPGNQGFEIPGGSASSGSAGRLPFEVPGSKPAEPAPQPQPQKNKWFSRQETPKPAAEPAVLKNVPANNYSGTVYVSAGDNDGGTVWENPAPEMPSQINAHLLRESTSEKVSISGTVFQIGSDYDYSDYHIGNNRSVGGTHAQILVKQGNYFIKDMNSKNHTYVDDRMIPGGVETPLYHGSRVRLGSERFIFYLY